MSFLAEVLQSAETIELKEVNTKISDISSAVENCKSEFLKFLEDVYVKFNNWHKQNKKLSDKSSELLTEVTQLKAQVENLTKNDLRRADNELAENIEYLEKTKLTISLIENVTKIHEGLIEIKELRLNKSYMKCMEKILFIQQLAISVPEDSAVSALYQLKVSIQTELNILLNKLLNTFQDNVILHCDDENGKCRIKISQSQTELEELLTALYYYRTSVTSLDNVTKFLWNYIFVPIVDCTTNIKISKENNFNILEVTTIYQTKNLNYFDIFKDIKTVAGFLSDNFNFPLNNNLTTLGYIGGDLGDNLSELIIKHCLESTIPSSKEDLEAYNIVIKETEELEKVLLQSNIFANNTASIISYANNIDVLFINKKCQDYLIKSELLMKKDLHNMEEIGVSNNANPLDNSNQFAKCCISKSVMEILNLTEEIVKEAVCASDLCAGRLVCTAQNIFLKYIIFVPEYHKKLLQTIPQQVALFHNNCMYMSYKLTEWNEVYSKQLSPVIKSSPDVFQSEICQLQKIASQKFSAYVESQIKLINDIMKGSGLESQNISTDSTREKCIRQCLRQQELLRTVWHKVLSYSIYNKNLGLILNSLCEYIINSVVKIEDIPLKIVEQFLDDFKIIQTRGPKLFTNPREIALFVQSWDKLNELIFVLSANLLDINDRWADGKGLLALQFKPKELRQLIKAIFQNSDNRAALLAKIRD